MEYQLFEGDCLQVMPTLAPQSIDAIIADPPYGTTACAWDSVIPFTQMWECIKRVIKPRCAVVLFGSQPFTSALVMSNPKWFRYAWVWDKKIATGHLNVKIKPLTAHEDIVVFSDGKHCYNRQFEEKPLYQRRPNKYATAAARAAKNGLTKNAGTIGASREGYSADNSDLLTNPKSILRIPNPNGADKSLQLHPTQKPVDLMAYLVRTYTNEGDTVLDFTMGSGSTGVACVETGRSFIGIELDPHYFAVASERIEAAYRKAQGLPKLGKATDTADLPLFAQG